MFWSSERITAPPNLSHMFIRSFLFPGKYKNIQYYTVYFRHVWYLKIFPEIVLWSRCNLIEVSSCPYPSWYPFKLNGYLHVSVWNFDTVNCFSTMSLSFLRVSYLSWMLCHDRTQWTSSWETPTWPWWLALIPGESSSSTPSPSVQVIQNLFPSNVFSDTQEKKLILKN